MHTVVHDCRTQHSKVCSDIFSCIICTHCVVSMTLLFFFYVVGLLKVWMSSLFIKGYMNWLRLWRSSSDNIPLYLDNHHSSDAVCRRIGGCRTWNRQPMMKNSFILKKGKVFPYSLPSVGPGADPGVQAVSPQVTWSESRHIPSSSPPLLSARPAFTFVAFTRWRHL